MSRPNRGEQSGFTLIELVITIVIMGVITLPLANFVLAYFKNYAQTQSRLSDSHDTQIAAAYFSQDVANVGVRTAYPALALQQSVWTPPTIFPASYCGKGLGTTILLLSWDDWTTPGSGAAPVDSAAYVVVSGTLHRVFCSGGVATTSDATVVHNLVYPDAGNTAPVMCPTSAAQCGTATPPAVVKLKLSIKAPADTAVSYVTLSGQRRQSSS
jgi:prepilin-type N-terminal cleavage/methylation domain-containing protein